MKVGIIGPGAVARAVLGRRDVLHTLRPPMSPDEAAALSAAPTISATPYARSPASSGCSAAYVSGVLPVRLENPTASAHTESVSSPGVSCCSRMSELSHCHPRVAVVPKPASGR